MTLELDEETLEALGHSRLDDYDVAAYFERRREIEARRVGRPAQEVGCKTCGSKVAALRKTRIFCSSACKQKFYRQVMRGQRPPRIKKPAKTWKDYREKQNARYRSDAEYRTRRLLQASKKFATDPEFREARRQYVRNRYANDPEFRAHCKERALRSYYRRKEKEAA